MFSWNCGLLAVALLLLPQALARAADKTVAVRNDSFSPQNVTIPVGGTVRWDASGASNNHTITNNGGAFNQNMPASRRDRTFDHTYSQAGNFPYYCRIHGRSMSGTV